MRTMSCIRNYASPDPTLVVRNIRHVLAKGDMGLLTKGAYEFLITHCGFIAHYNHAGFVATYRDGLPAFVDQFLSQHGMGWTTWLDNPRSYLYDVSYKGQMLAEIIQELVPIFQAHAPGIKAADALRREAAALAQLHALAERLGYDLVRRA